MQNHIVGQKCAYMHEEKHVAEIRAHSIHASYALFLLLLIYFNVLSTVTLFDWRD